MNKHIIVIALTMLVASPAFATYRPHPTPVEPPPIVVVPPVVVTPVVTPQTPNKPSDSEYSQTTPQYWTGTCELTTDGKVLVHTAASFLKLFNKEKAMKLAGEQCIERLIDKGILQSR